MCDGAYVCFSVAGARGGGGGSPACRDRVSGSDDTGGPPTRCLCTPVRGEQPCPEEACDVSDSSLQGISSPPVCSIVSMGIAISSNQV